jgi:biotin carboxyl carrier protein
MRRYTIEVDGCEFVIDIDDLDTDRFRVVVDGHAYEAALKASEDLDGGAALTTPPGPAAAAPAPRTLRAAATPAALAAAAAGAGLVLGAPMPGSILRLAVTPGTRVSRGQDIAVLEAMKMENIIRAPQPGVIAEVFVQPGEQVAHGQPIVRFAPEAAS